MAKCGACDSTILFGGVQWGAWTCCNAGCVAGLKRALTRELVPAADIEKEVERVHAANCPACGREGPNDLYTTRKVTGMIVAVQWATERHLCCAPCAKRKRLAAFAHCLALGWWSPKAFLTNLFYVPYNLVGALLAKPALRPSRDLETAVLELIAEANAAHFVQGVRQRAK